MKNNQPSHSAQAGSGSGSATRRLRVPVVGIGASAGGLEALELFLNHVPPGSGLAYVVIQHLDPDYKGVLVELLQNATVMPVAQIEDGMKVKADHVYVIPPNHDIALLHGVLHLKEPTASRGFRLPIDHFFRSLAQDLGEIGTGVILSGMGSDGTLGLRSIKEHAGGAFVQTPETAKFDSMPRSAIDAGLADVVAPAEDLPARILGYLKHVPDSAGKSVSGSTQGEADSIGKILLLLLNQTGHDFSLYKKNTLHRRIERRMGLHQLRTVGDYARYLQENPQETKLLFKELLIGVTQFFRDPDVWEQLGSEVLPSLLAAMPKGGVFRAWVPACSTGEEAYSLAMVFYEVLERVKPDVRYTLQIFATDLDADAIDRARAGVFPANIAADVSEERLRRFFVQEDGRYRISGAIRETVVFAPQNLIMDPPFTKLDLLSCRNFLIYVEASLQKKLLALFHFSLKPGGVLLLGNAETASDATPLFAALPGRTRLYRRRADHLRTEMNEFTPSLPRSRLRGEEGFSPPLLAASATRAPNIQEAIDALLLRHFCPPTVLTTTKGDILYISGKTGRYLEPAAGKANLNIFAMARDGVSPALSVLFSKAVRERAPQTAKAVAAHNEAGTNFVDITVQMLDDPAVLKGMVLVVFSNAATPSPEARVAESEVSGQEGASYANLSNELRLCREQLQITREEMQSSQEELKSANEELQSTNEELQSTNEELTTSKEEMQSINEELHTVNTELQAKVDELSHASDDMKNLLNSTNIATLFLDDQLKVRRFTERMTDIVKLIPSDVGRPITDLVTRLNYTALADDVQEVLRSLVFRELVIPSHDGRWFSTRIMPYRTHDNRIDGVVMTFVDVSEARLQEQTLQAALDVLQAQFDEQSGELERAYELEQKMKNARSILEERLARLKS